MKKLLVLMIGIVNVVYAQNLGFNGAGFFENYDPSVEQYLKDMHQPFTLRVPGGAISKFHDPYNVKRGWGMSQESINTWFNKTGFDEDGNGLEKWLRKAQEQPDHSYLDDLIALQQKFPEMQVLYVLNILNSTPEANMQAIRYLMEHHVKVVGVEAGNEVYGKYASFDEYIKDFEPVFNMLDKEYPQIKKGLVGGANTSRKDIVKWNQGLAAYKGKYDAVILHYYYTQKELGEAYDMIPLRSDYQPGGNNPSLDKAFVKASDLLMCKKLIEDGVADAKYNFKGKEIWITEWNTKPSDMLCNTILNGAWQFKEMMTLRNDVQYLLVHNGVSPDKYGMITKSTKADSEPGDMIRRMGYWAYILAGEATGAQELKKDTNLEIKKENGKEQRIWFTNMSDAYAAKLQYDKNAVASVTINYVSGDHLYSASGATGYMGKGTPPNYEVKGITRGKFDGNIPKFSFGYIVIQFK